MNTPKKAVKFSNEIQLQKPIPHIVFVVFDSKNYKTSILKVLLNFYFHVNPCFTFSILSNGSAKKVYEFNSESLQELDAVVPVKCNLSDMIKILYQIVHEVNWNSNSAVPLQSPVKKDLTWAKNVKIRNYLFMIGNLPEDIPSLQKLVENGSNDQIQLLESLNEQFLSESLWIAFAKSRISLCWLHQHIVGKEFALTEAWISCLFKQCGSFTLNESLLEEEQFPKIWEEFLQPSVMDLALVKLLCQKKNSRAKLFHEHIDKAYIPCGSFKYPKVWSGSMSLKDPVSWPHLLPSTLICIIACKIKPGVETADYTGMKIIGVAECERLPGFSNEDGFCVPASGEVGLKDFAYIMSFLSYRSLCILVEFQVKNTAFRAALRSIAPSLAGFYLLPTDSSISVCPYDETVLIGKKHPDHDISTWFKPKWPTPLSHFLKTGKILSKQSDFIQKACLGVWTIANSSFVLTPKPKNRVTSFRPEKRKIERVRRQVEIPAYKTVEEALKGLNYFYYTCLFQKNSIVFFLEAILPKIYEQLSALCEKEDCDETEVLLEFLGTKLMISIQDIEENHSKRLLELSFLTDFSDSKLQPEIQSLAHAWFLKQRQSKFNADVEPKSVLKRSVRLLRSSEGQIQLVLWLECMRICRQQEMPYPQTLLFKVKKKRKIDYGDHLQSAIYNLVDKLLLWAVTVDTEGNSNGVLKDFILPVVMPFYNESLPEITSAIFSKAGGDVVQEEVIAQSPIIKKSKVVRKPIVMLDNSKKRIKRAASSLLGMQKRQVGKFEKKKGSRKSLFDVSNDSSDENGNRSMTLDEFFLSPKKDVQICIPETPTTTTRSKHILMEPPSGNYLMKTPKKKAKSNEFGSPIF